MLKLPKDVKSIYPEALVRFKLGENVQLFLEEFFKDEASKVEIIELSYDLQAGSYTQYFNDHKATVNAYITEISQILSAHIEDGDSLLDIGTGECTIFTSILNMLSFSSISAYAFDISWSRLYHGKRFARANLARSINLQLFCADIHCIPLASKSINVTTSSHALEPNGGYEAIILEELFRVTIKMLILFEPSYELNSNDGRERMERLGYVRNLPFHIEQLGAELLECRLIKSTQNSLNPTCAYVIRPPPSSVLHETSSNRFSDPISKQPLDFRGDCYYSPSRGVAYPILAGIPVLRNSVETLASSMG